MRACMVWLSGAVLGVSACSDQTGAADVLVVEEVTVDPPSVALAIGSQRQLSATPRTASGLEIPNRDVTWFSPDPDIATVSSTGLVTAVFPGRTGIVAQVDDVSAVVPVTVNRLPVAWVVIQPAALQVKVGRTRQLDAFVFALSGKPLTDRLVVFNSDRPEVAAVSSSGLVVAVGPGETIVRARSEGKEGIARVTVER